MWNMNSGYSGYSMRNRAADAYEDGEMPLSKWTKKMIIREVVEHEHFTEEELKKYPAEDVYCIGGDTIYKQLLPYCDAAQVTKIDFAYIADSYFPNLDEDPQWHVAAESEEQTYFDLEYKFVRYERNK